MWNFLAPPYNSFCWLVVHGIFIGYAGFYIVRKNF